MKALPRPEWAWAGWVAALPVLLMPVGDPDSWWHLSAARWMIEHRAFPRVDWLSFTAAGTPWVDFEWLSQLVFHGAFSCAGPAGLWALKALLLVLAGLSVDGLMRRSGLDPEARALGLSLWAAAMLPRSDIRTELFSLAAFARLLLLLEDGRLRPLPLLIGFSAWANLHAGFAYGLLLLGLHAAASSGRREALGRLWCLAAAAAGTLATPYGFSVYAVLVRHSLDAGPLRDAILEWGGLRPGRFVHWPAFVLLAVAAAVVWRGGHREGLRPSWRGVALALFGLSALRHARTSSYFAILAVPWSLSALRDMRVWPEDAEPRRALACALSAAVFVFGLWCGRPVGVLRRLSHELHVPARAAGYIERHPELPRGPWYHPWGWGGYLGYRFGASRPVFQDGRYIFHPLLLQAGEAIRSPESWARFLSERGIVLALLENAPLQVRTVRGYPDGSRREFFRPYYTVYMPARDWALLYWDEEALLFVRRDSMAPHELSRLEYRLARPGDGDALADAMSRGEVDPGLLRRELDRHGRESTRRR